MYDPSFGHGTELESADGDKELAKRLERRGLFEDRRGWRRLLLKSRRGISNNDSLRDLCEQCLASSHNLIGHSHIRRGL